MSRGIPFSEKAGTDEKDQAGFFAPDHGGKHEKEEARGDQRLLQDNGKYDAYKEDVPGEVDDWHRDSVRGVGCCHGRRAFEFDGGVVVKIFVDSECLTIVN